jgi:hypothetical protein
LGFLVIFQVNCGPFEASRQLIRLWLDILYFFDLNLTFLQGLLLASLTIETINTLDSLEGLGTG